MSRSVIVSAVRTPFGKLGGALANYEATELGAIAIRAALDRAGVENEEGEHVFHVDGKVLRMRDTFVIETPGGGGYGMPRQRAKPGTDGPVEPIITAR